MRILRSLVPPELGDRLVALRRDLHQHPELAFTEHRTASVLEREVAQLANVTVDRVAPTGLVARIPGARAGAPVVAIRADIDALPIQEATELPFASTTKGVMHACGHDIHATWAVGAAALLRLEPAAGDVLIVFQPAEEIAEGARTMLASGCLADVRAIFGGHVDRRFTVGQVVAQAGPLAASTDEFEIVLQGRGGHGARPHEAADPIVALGAVITSLQTIVSRRVNPAKAGVVTIGMVSGGTASNVIPEQVTLRGTLRATDEETRSLLRSELAEIATHAAAAHHVEARVALLRELPPVINSPEAAAWAAEAAAAVLGAEAVVPLTIANMAGEDFAFYLESLQGCFLRIGARRDGEPVIPAHSPQFDVAEEAIFVGAAVLAESARRASAALANNDI